MRLANLEHTVHQVQSTTAISARQKWLRLPSASIYYSGISESMDPKSDFFLCVVTTALYVAAHTVHILFTFSFWFGFLIKYVYRCQYIFAANFKLFKSYICKNARITECDSKSWSNITF